LTGTPEFLPSNDRFAALTMQSTRSLVISPWLLDDNNINGVPAPSPTRRPKGKKEKKKKKKRKKRKKKKKYIQKRNAFQQVGTIGEALRGGCDPVEGLDLVQVSQRGDRGERDGIHLFFRLLFFRLLSAQLRIGLG